jgi:hypothetical protein
LVVVLGFELRALNLLDRSSTIYTTLPALFALDVIWIWAQTFCPVLALDLILLPLFPG